jgi:two-component system cell cycle sensor histidine kinase/response regulator CckA
VIGFLRRRPPSVPQVSTRLIDRLAGPLDPALALLFQEPSAGRLIVDRHGRLLRASEALQRMAGTAFDLSPGMPILLLFAPEERDAVWIELSPVLRGQTRPAPSRPFSARLAGSGTEPLTVAVTASPVREADGAGSGAMLTVRDITAQAQLEAQLAHSQRLQAAGQLAGGIAHDFNNLLTAILGATEAVAAQEGLSTEAQEELAQIRASAERGATLVRQLLAFGRQQTLQPRVLAVNDVLSGIAAMLRRLLGSRVRLELALEQPGPHIRVDPTALDQVLINLAVNARDAMPQGGVLTLRSGHITLYQPLPRGPETIPPGRYVMIEVQDTGTGIAPENLPRIFEPFFTTRREQGGTGLGLATVHGIVRQSDGFRGVESEPGTGTRLRVYLPRWEGTDVMIPAPPAAKPPLGAPMPAQRGTVLLVEDEPTVRQVTERALRRLGWQVLAAESAEEALTLLDGAPAPLLLAAVVTDLVMPGQNGATFVRALRERLGMPELPAILVSGYATEGIQQEVMATLGTAGTLFLPKPYEIVTLAAKIAEVTAAGVATSDHCSV